MGVPVIVEAVRTPIAKRGGALARLHATVVLGATLREVLARSGLDAAEVGQVIGGCVTQVGEQSFNITRMAWLTAGLPIAVGATTIDCQCGSSQQANHMISNMIAAGVIDIGIACGVEMMSRVPMGANAQGPGSAKPDGFPYDLASQFVSAERLAQKYRISRSEADSFACETQQRAAEANAGAAFRAELCRIEDTVADECPRATTIGGLAELRPLRERGIHTAGSVSPIADGAAAVLWMDADRARALGLRPRARLRAQVLVGTDPYYHIEGPVDATRALLDAADMALADIDQFEINEAFASVVLAWQHTFQVPREKLNVNGGAIALGHPMGASGARLLTTALHSLERRGHGSALIAMCCGGALATGSILERVEN